ncbi:MAG TPA: tetratricopeptide repeat protein, partial [Blastocatellia bacterium]|nr:tetratricopeptide repeat protein [Blastocatellia bacterium]
MAARGEHPPVSAERKRRPLYQDPPGNLALFLLFSLLTAAFSLVAFGRASGLIRHSAQAAAQRPGTGPDGPDLQPLEPGRPVNRELADGQRHSYGIRLGAGQFLKVVVEQQAIDVIVQVLGPDGRQILEVDTENGLREQEAVPLAAESAGEYRLILRPAQQGAAAGRYEIRIVELRAATARDLSLHEAQQLNQEAETLERAGRYEEALRPAERALAIRETMLGMEHLEVAASLNMLSVLYYHRDEYAKARELLQRALAIREKLRGPDHPDVATALNNLGQLSSDRGDYVTAESLYTRALAI